jgi:hypothetical protein
MSDLRMFFDERKSEVDVYFNFIKYIGIDNINHKKIKFDTRINFQTTDDLKKVLKSNCILILYNLIEGVISKSIEEIFDTINNKQIKYNELKLGLKNILLKTPNFQKKFKEINNDLVLFIDGIFDEIFYYEMSNFKNTKNIVLGGGGNIDARFIKENIAKNLHINFKRREDSLRTIKTNRNHLAHGEKSYIECSQDKTFRDIKKWKTATFNYLEKYVSAIEKYIQNEDYKG